MTSVQLNSNLSTLFLMTLKDIRLERGVHQGVISQQVGKTPSAWTKVENGQARLTIDAMLGAASALQMNPTNLILLVERIFPYFSQAGWFFHTAELDPSEDDLIRLMGEYYNSPGYKGGNPYERISIMTVNFNFFGVQIPTIVRYCCDPSYRDLFSIGLPPLQQIPTL